MYYNHPVRSIAFPQGYNYTCAFLSFCSAIYAFADGNNEIQQFTTLIHNMQKQTQDPNVFENLKRAVDNVT